MGHDEYHPWKAASVVVVEEQLLADEGFQRQSMEAELEVALEVDQENSSRLTDSGRGAERGQRPYCRHCCRWFVL